MAKAKPLPSPPLDPACIPWLLAVALATAGPHAPHQPMWLIALSALLIAWRGVLWRRHAVLPPRLALAVVMTIGVLAIGFHYRTLFGRDAGVALLVLLMAGKPLEARARRDALVIVMLGYFLLLTHYFYSQSIATGAWLLAALTLTTATLIRLHGAATWRELLRLAASLLLQAAPLMLALFILFPRVQGPLWGLPRDAHAGLTGLSEQMAPGTLSRLILSGSIAFRVRFDGATPPPAELYWRGPVLEDFDGQSWSRAPFGSRSTAPLPKLEQGTKKYRYETTLEAHNQRWLLALDLPFARPPDSQFSSRLETLSREPVRQRARFGFASAIDARANLEEAAATLRQALNLPSGRNPKSLALGETWQRKYAGDVRQISAAALHFFREESFYYTLNPPLTGAQAVDDFLFNTRRGFCEHYASAYVVLMRAAGVPARVVTGYQGGEVNPVDKFLTVRQSDAHAWAEIWLAGEGWQRVDPTAAVSPARIERGIEAALPVGEALPALFRVDIDWLRTLRFRWEAVNNAWHQWVLGYNPDKQRETLNRLGLADPDWRKLTALLAMLCGVVLLALTGWMLYRRPRPDSEQRAWARFCAALARQGIVRADWEGPQVLAARTGREKPHLAALAQNGADAYARLRYGDTDAAGKAKALNELEDCTRRLARQPAPQRRSP